MKDLVGYLYKAVKTILLYPTTNPLPGEFKAQLFDRLTAFLEEEGNLALTIRGDQFLFEGEVVHEEAGGDDNFIATLHRDGIQKLMFRQGLEAEELDRFLEIVKKVITERSQDDDLVTLLWEASFDSIKYESISELNEIDYEAIENRFLQNQADADARAGAIDYGSIVLDESEADREGSPAQGSDDTTRTSALGSVDVSRIVEDLNGLSDDMSKVDDYLREATQFDPANSTIGIIFEILIGEEEVPGFRETCDVVDNLYDRFIQQADFHSAFRVLTGIHELQATEVDHSPARVQRLSESRARSADKLRTDHLVAALNGHPGCDLDSCRALLQSLPIDILPYLVSSLGDLEHFACRTMMCETLAERGVDRVDTIGNGVYDKRWYVVRNIVVILGNIGGNRALTFLQKALKHADDRVRREVIGALVRMDPQDSSKVLRAGLDDKTADIRILSLRALSKRNDEETAVIARKRIAESTFKRLEPTEQKQLLISVARIQGDSSLPVFRKLIGGLGWFDNASTIRLKSLATTAMAEGRGVELHAYLVRLSVEKKDAIGDAARRSLARMKSPTSETLE